MTLIAALAAVVTALAVLIVGLGAVVSAIPTITVTAFDPRRR